MSRFIGEALVGVALEILVVVGLWFLVERGDLSIGQAVGIAIVALLTGVLLLRRAAAREAGDKAKSDLTWIDIEERFESLRERAIRYSHDTRDPRPLTGMQGDSPDGKDWWITGSGGSYQRELAQLCVLAGRKLKRDGYANSDRLKRVKDDQDRWLWFLVEIGETDTKSRWETSGSGEPTKYHFVLRDLAKSCVAGAKHCVGLDVLPTP